MRGPTMYVCVCNKVTDHEIRDAADRGIDTFDKLCAELRVGGCCGRCKDCAHRVLNQAISQQWTSDPAFAVA